MASEMLLQKNLEITEIKSSEARTIAATSFNAVNVGSEGGCLNSEANTVGTSDDKDGDGCTVQ